MDAWILGYQKSVKGAGKGVSADAWAMHELEAPEPPPSELRALYSAFDGGLLEGSVKLYRFGQVLEHRNSDVLPAWLFGEKGETRLMAARKATLAAQPGLQLRPSWFEATSADALVFAKKDGRSGAVRVYPSLEQLLAVMVPPAQLEAFGENTYARAMAAVEDALGNVTASDARGLGLKKKQPKKKKAVVVKKSKSPTPKGRKKSPMAAKKSVKKPAKKAAAKKPAKKVAAKKPAKKVAAKKPAKKVAAKKPAKKAAAKKHAAKKVAAKKPVAKKAPAAKKPAAKKAPAPAAASSFLAPAPAPAPVAEPAPAPAPAPVIGG